MGRNIKTGHRYIQLFKYNLLDRIFSYRFISQSVISYFRNKDGFMKFCPLGRNAVQLVRFLLIACISISFCEYTYGQNDPVAGLHRVVIDAGHGGRDPGAVGATSKEKDIVLDIALRLGKLIQGEYPNVEVVYTRKTDVFVDLDKRGDIANKAKADLFISIHANANPSKRPYGAETFVMGPSKTAENMEVAKRENSVILIEDDYSTRYEDFDPKSPESYIFFSMLQNAYLNQSLNFAAEVQEHFTTTAQRTNRGVKQAGFLVLWRTTMPSALVEVGFISNLAEEKYMSSDAGKNQLAESIFKAFCKYKEQVEERSAFKPVSTTKPSTVAANQNETNHTDSAASLKPEKNASTPTQSPKTEFCIQIGTSSKSIDPTPSNFKKYQGVERIQHTQNLFKYVVNRTNEYIDAQQALRKIKVDFPDAFIVGISEGKIITASEALKLIGQ